MRTSEQKQEWATRQRERYHSDKDYRKKQIQYSSAWIKRNRERVNVNDRKLYANLSNTKKEARLRKVRRMRRLKLWKS